MELQIAYIVYKWCHIINWIVVTDETVTNICMFINKDALELTFLYFTLSKLASDLAYVHFLPKFLLQYWLKTQPVHL